MANRKTESLRALVRDILAEELNGMLADVSYRLSVLYDAQNGGRYGSRDLMLATHQIDGFTVTDNSPSTGYIAWADVNIVYKGVNYAVTNGNTNKKYVFWKLNTTPTTLQTSDTKPTLSDDDVLVFINDAGIHQTAISAGRLTHGAAIIAGTVGSGEIKSGAIDSTKIADGAVAAAKIMDGAVGTGKLAASAVNATNLADGAVTSGKIAGGAVGTTQLAGSAVTANKIASSAVTTDKINNGAITGVKIGAGAVATDKLNTALHMIF